MNENIDVSGREVLADPPVVIREGDLTDLRESLGIITDGIEEKADLTVEETLRRLSTKDYHLKIAENGKGIEGVYIWYGPHQRRTDCYLWLGAVRESGRCVGSLLIEETLRDMRECGYSEVYVKTKQEKGAAIRLLEKYGFTSYREDGDGLVYMRRRLSFL